MLALVASLGLWLALSAEVETAVSVDDRDYLQKIMAETGLSPLPAQPSSQQETDFILAAQHAVLQLAPVDKALPLDQSREPKDLYAARHGLCYDRSRVLEKLYRAAGFEARHVSLYSLREHSLVAALLTPQVSSHAVTEVRTARGWLLVDSNRRWISLTADGEPVPLARIQAQSGAPLPRWDARNAEMPKFYMEPFAAVYGLYSRHGRFYPPFNPIPDINWAEFKFNLGL